MTTVSHAVESMNGTIHVESTVGKGSTFTVKIPFKIIQNAPIRQTDTEEDKRMKLQFEIQNKYLHSISSSEQLTSDNVTTAPVLVAEDNPINRKVICKLVNSLGFETESVNDGLELIGKFDNSRHKVIITDMVSVTC